MEDRRPVDGVAAALMVALCAIWGMQQVSLKAAAPLMAPLMQVAVRSGIAAPVVAAFMLARRDVLGFRAGTWRPGLLAGLLFALQFLFIGEALHFTSAAHTVIFLYTAPIFVALGLHWWIEEERLDNLQWLGIGVAFVGVIVSLAGSVNQHARNQSWIGDLLAVAGGVSWCATTLTVRFSKLAHTAASATLLYQLTGAFILLCPAAFLLR